VLTCFIVRMQRVPQRTGFIPRRLRVELERTELLKRLRRCQDFTVVALLAPSGFGKTTLLAQFARRTKSAVVWVTLTNEDAEVGRFCDSVLRSVRHALSDLELVFVDEALADQASYERLARALALDLNSSRVNVSLFLDRTEVLTKDSASWLEAFVETLQEGHQVFLSGYDSGVLPLMKWIGRDTATVFEINDLAFLETETRVLLQRYGEEQRASDVHQLLQGWAAGIVLTAGKPTKRGSAADLMSERLQILQFRRMLSRCAVFDTWDEHVAALVGAELPKDWINQLLRQGFPLTPLGKNVFRPHALLLEALDQELKLDSVVYQELHAMAGEHAHKHGDLFSAIAHFQNANRYERALQTLDGLIF
jgi:LuxR family transcriptional regulator, maltose regulon positive regulatory protein